MNIKNFENFFTAFLFLGLLVISGLVLAVNYRFAKTCRVVVNGQCVMEKLDRFETVLEAAQYRDGR